jgi:hypothetical protein
MYENIAHRDYIKSELEYRLNRAQADLAGRRKRRALVRRSRDVDGLNWNTVR